MTLNVGECFVDFKLSRPYTKKLRDPCVRASVAASRYRSPPDFAIAEQLSRHCGMIPFFKGTRPLSQGVELPLVCLIRPRSVLRIEGTSMPSVFVFQAVTTATTCRPSRSTYRRLAMSGERHVLTHVH